MTTGHDELQPGNSQEFVHVLPSLANYIVYELHTSQDLILKL